MGARNCDILEAVRTSQKEEGSPRFHLVRAGREDEKWKVYWIWPPGGSLGFEEQFWESSGERS